MSQTQAPNFKLECQLFSTIWKAPLPQYKKRTFSGILKCTDYRTRSEWPSARYNSDSSTVSGGHSKILALFRWSSTLKIKLCFPGIGCKQKYFLYNPKQGPSSLRVFRLYILFQRNSIKQIQSFFEHKVKRTLNWLSSCTHLHFQVPWISLE
jgi:hypothetical protein